MRLASDEPMGWRWKVLRCPHCREELRTRIICVEAEREIDRLRDQIDQLVAVAVSAPAGEREPRGIDR